MLPINSGNLGILQEYLLILGQFYRDGEGKQLCLPCDGRADQAVRYY
jgi:hypothetical protein